MEYFSILNFDREPFSNSPDPRFFFHSRQHRDCLNKVEIAIRLKRGLSVILGDVGTGKSTLCRELIRKLAEDEKIDTHLFLTPPVRQRYPVPLRGFRGHYGHCRRRGGRMDPQRANQEPPVPGRHGKRPHRGTDY